MMSVERIDPDKIALLTGSTNPQLAEDVGNILGIPIQQSVGSFANSESRVSIPDNIRRRDVIILQTGSAPVNDSVMETVLLADAAKKASAGWITGVIPCFPYARQDRKEKPRVPISGAIVARMFEIAGIRGLLTVDIHSEPIEGSFIGPWDNVYSSYSLVPKIRELELEDLIVASPDKGGFERAKAYSELLAAEGVALVYKERDINVANKSEASDMIGIVEKKNVLIVDDIIDTAGTIAGAAKVLYDNGAKSIWVAAAHAMFSGDTYKKIIDSPIKGVFITDSLPHQQEVVDNEKFHNVSIAPLLAGAIECIVTGESISKRYIDINGNKRN